MFDRVLLSFLYRYSMIASGLFELTVTPTKGTIVILNWNKKIGVANSDFSLVYFSFASFSMYSENCWYTDSREPLKPKFFLIVEYMVFPRPLIPWISRDSRVLIDRRTNILTSFPIKSILLSPLGYLNWPSHPIRVQLLFLPRYSGGVCTFFISSESKRFFPVKKGRKPLKRKLSFEFWDGFQKFLSGDCLFFCNFLFHFRLLQGMNRHTYQGYNGYSFADSIAM